MRQLHVLQHSFSTCIHEHVVKTVLVEMIMVQICPKHLIDRVFDLLVGILSFQLCLKFHQCFDVVRVETTLVLDSEVDGIEIGTS